MVVACILESHYLRKALVESCLQKPGLTYQCKGWTFSLLFFVVCVCVCVGRFGAGGCNHGAFPNYLPPNWHGHPSSRLLKGQRS